MDHYSYNSSSVTSNIDDYVASSNVFNSHFVPLIDLSLPDNVVVSHDTGKMRVPLFITVILMRRYHMLKPILQLL